MVDTPKILAALQAIHDELPALLGPDDWAHLDERVQELIQAVEQGQLEQRQLPSQVLIAFRRFPAANARLLRELQGAADSPLKARGWGIGAKLTELMHPLVTRHLDFGGPSAISLDCPRFLVVLRLKVPSDPDVSGPEVVQAREGLPVWARVEAPEFEVLNGDTQQTAILADRDSPSIVFDLKPRRAGAWRVNVDLYQEGHLLGSASLAIEVTEQPVTSESPRSVAAQLQTLAQGAPPDRVLRVTCSGTTLHFTLLDPHGGWRRLDPVELGETPQSHADRHFRELRQLARGQGGAPPISDHTLKTLGQDLWQRLLPRELQRLYQEQHKAWRDSTLLICTDEPWIPWELLWPRAVDWTDSWEAEEPLCLSLRLTRWLCRSSAAGWQAAPPNRLPLRAAAVLAPTNSGLAAAQTERDQLINWLGARGVRDLSPPPTKAGVISLLDVGGYDWIHACAHGTFNADHADLDAPLLLENNESLRPFDLATPSVAHHIARRRPAFVLNACHLGRQGWGMGGLDGWPSRLVEIGAGMVLGALWPVRDVAAGQFAQHLYDALGQGKTLADAVRQARLAIRRAGDPTWLAYTVYGHPNAMLELPDPKGTP